MKLQGMNTGRSGGGGGGHLPVSDTEASYNTHHPVRQSRVHGERYGAHARQSRDMRSVTGSSGAGNSSGGMYDPHMMRDPRRQSPRDVMRHTTTARSSPRESSATRMLRGDRDLREQIERGHFRRGGRRGRGAHSDHDDALHSDASETSEMSEMSRVSVQSTQSERPHRKLRSASKLLKIHLCSVTNCRF